MKGTFASGALPYTAAERAIDRFVRNERIKHEGKPILARRRSKLGGRYDKQASPQTKARDLRILGESESM